MTTRPKLKLVPVTPDAVNIADAINDAIQFAEGIAIAIIGEGHLSGHDSSPLSQLLETHIAKLEEIGDAYDKLRTDIGAAGQPAVVTKPAA